MKAETKTVNLDDIDAKRRLMADIGRRRGLWDVTLKQRRRTRSLNANAYYHVAVCAEWAMWLREQYGDDSITHEQAHEALKKIILGSKDKPLPNGEAIEIIPETKRMDVGEFGDYIENCARFLAEFCGIAVISSDEFWESKSKLRKAS